MATLHVLCPVALVQLACALESDSSSVAVCPLVLSLAYILGSSLVVVPEAILLYLINSFGRVLYIVFVFILAKSVVCLSDFLLQVIIDALIHAYEGEALVSWRSTASWSSDRELFRSRAME